MTAFETLTAHDYWVPEICAETGFSEEAREAWCVERLRVIGELGIPPDRDGQAGGVPRQPVE
jgi:hypothetical protein